MLGEFTALEGILLVSNDRIAETFTISADYFAEVFHQVSLESAAHLGLLGVELGPDFDAEVARAAIGTLVEESDAGKQVNLCEVA